MIRLLCVLCAAVLLLGCSPDDEQVVASATPAPPQGPVDPAMAGPDPCDLLTPAEVAAAVGEEQVGEGGLSGGQVFLLCTYQLSGGVSSVDVALVDLDELAKVDARVSGDTYIESLADGAGAGIVAELEGVGEGEAITIAYEGGSQAWGWRGDLVVGAYADALEDNTAAAVRLLEAALAQVEG